MNHLWAQTGVLDPNDPIVEYNQSSPPATPPYGTLAKWVRTSRFNWNTNSYKAYYYNGLAFRLKFPKTYTPGTTKKYPILIFFHGVGEKGKIYDNEFQLYHGGEVFAGKVDNGSFDGFLLFPQNQSGFFGNAQYDVINSLINNYLIPQVNVDPWRIYVNGLSGGGSSTWEYMMRYPKQVATATPISAASVNFKSSIDIYKFTPIWLFQGGKDNNPDPGTTQNLFAAVKAAGGNMDVKVYENVGHSCWYQAWAEPNFFPFLLKGHKANPWPLFGRTEFCPGDPISVVLGLTAGFDAYEWRKDGEVIPDATGNTLTVTAIGTYDARIKNGSSWSPYSPVPVVIQTKTATIPPDITIPGIQSKVLPTPEGKTSVTLEVPIGYASYSWRKTTDTATELGKANTFSASAPGGYVVKVMEQYGCASAFSNPFQVISASGANTPAPASGLTALAAGKTQVELNWTRNPNAPNPETGYEIYRSTTTGSGYTLAAITEAGTVNYTDNGLNANTRYYYIIRAVNNNGAAAVSNEANAKTLVDNINPTSPMNLRITGTSSNYVDLAWEAATDDVGVDKYDIYINGIKSYVVPGTQTTFTAYNLTKGQQYTFVVKARDLVGNISPASNQAATQAVLKGLTYRVYNGTFTKMPDFTTLTNPVATGIAPAVDLSIRKADTKYAIIWQGFINIPVSGSYTFGTTSDDGSKIYINKAYSATATPTIDHGGPHGTTSKEATLNLTAGIYPFTATYFQQSGGQAMDVYWKNTANGITTAKSIAPEFFRESIAVPGNPPAAVSGIDVTALSYDKIRVNWNDNSNNEKGFEIYRANNPAGPYSTIYTTAANVTSFTDSALVPQTTYYYKVLAVNQYGDAGFSQDNYGALAYSFYYTTGNGTLPDFNTLTPITSGYTNTVSLTPATRGTNFSLLFKGIINIPTTGAYTFYTRSDDGSVMLIDGAQIVNNNYSQGVTERSGNVNLTAGTHLFQVGYSQGSGSSYLKVSYRGPNIVKQEIPDSAYVNNKMRATTLALPGSPLSPSALVAASLTPTRIKLTWNDNSNNETGFEVYRANSSGGTYTLIGTLDAAINTYLDTTLSANTAYYYKVRAMNAGGYSGMSNEASVTTLNNAPVFSSQLKDYAIHYSTPLVINITATDADDEPLNFTGTNIPAFGTLTDNGNGTASLTFTPTENDLGIYNDIKVTVQDQHQGITSQTFKLTVKNTYPPVLSTINNINVNSGATAQIPLTATNNNVGDVLTWSVNGLPAFATFNSDGNTAGISLAPGNADAGIYPVSVTINGNGGTDTRTFSITVNAINPNKRVYINFTDGVTVAGGYWNNTTKQPVLNDQYSNLKDSSNQPTTLGFQIMTPWQNLTNGSNTLGATTGNNSGVYPDVVMQTAYWSTTVKQTIKFTGLKTGADYKYAFTFFGSRGGVTDNRTSLYTINGASVSLNAASNKTNTVTLYNVVPNANGEVTLDMQNAPGSQYSYLNALVIDLLYDDHTPPAKPGNISAQQAAKGVKVSWTDFSYNETGFEVYRADSLHGAYTLLTNPATNANVTSYIDSTAKANATYAYTVKAVNTYGSRSSDSILITTGNNNPVLPAISNVTLKTGDTLKISLRATDDPEDQLTFSASGLPAFATLTDNGNGTGLLTLLPGNNAAGNYNNITVKVADNNGGSATRTFNIAVKDRNITAVYINVNDANPAGTPWNNVNATPGAGKTLSNLLDEYGTATGINLVQVDAIQGFNSLGATTGNNSGVYPDAVMQTNYFEGSDNARKLRLTNVPSGKKYNLVFFGSRSGATDNKNTDYTAGGQTVTLNAASNTRNTAQINGLSPDADGNIEFTFKRSSGSSYGYLAAIVLQSYIDNGLPAAPNNLYAVGTSKSAIKLTWTDRASNESGYEVWRSNTAEGAYSLITTVGANVVTYQDNGLGSNTTYYYKVRAVAGNINSEYSNTANAATYAYTVFLNFNRDNPADAPWNNTNNVPMPNQVFDNLLNDEGNKSGVSVTIVNNFSGENPFGMNTGNNSGVYPDNVIRSTYWLDYGIAAKLRIDGLNQSQAYSFTFFGSREGGGDRTTVYTINGNSVSLNCSNNINQTVTLSDIRPDANGGVFLDVTLGPTATYGYLGALVISGYNAKEPDAAKKKLQSLVQNKAVGAAILTNKNSSGNTIADKEKTEILNVYPNPFKDQVYLQINNTGSPKNLLVKLFTSDGKLVSAKQLSQVAPGTQVIKVPFDNAGSLSMGVYILQITNGNKQVQTFKLIKN
ncbi:fibronectin type III domain-containing protein [Chitinophaga nivalis]|uniref:Fibronectin type III domain-containing protein n=1 Tax=Chitinophaga nivalis TaxID=2991709 RepID=A0ABT3ILW2_9BACT|nr:fibronectin type III domain-containing protein [Chitinophaga nivalis]MCW3465412.1 fibronectin type III domain-containing protein [Chitinophaga nivalis]MCW3484896.1 fibronectin type III domain-containing protein [Chitinophaga nivalis]